MVAGFTTEVLSPRLVLITNCTVKIVKVGGSEAGSDGSTLCNCSEVPTHVAERELALLRHP